MSYQILRASEVDAEALSQLARKTFDDTFSSTNSAADMQLYMQNHFYPEKQRQEIIDPRRWVFIAWHQKQAIGYMQLVQGTSEPCITATPHIELSRIYIDKDWHGKGLAQEFIELAFKTAQELGCKSIWLGVWEENHRALKFYQKMGFQKVGSHIFMMGLDPQTDFVLEKVF